MKIKNTKVIDVMDWDELVSNTYDKPYCFQQQDDCQPRGIVNITIPSECYDEDDMNDRIPEIINGEGGDEMGIKFSVWISRDANEPLNPTKEDLKRCSYYWGKNDEDLKKWCEDKSHISMFWERNFYPNLQSVANDLHKKGLIESGEYGIEIDW